jgi:hypothetical protein
LAPWFPVARFRGWRSIVIAVLIRRYSHDIHPEATRPGALNRAEVGRTPSP